MMSQKLIETNVFDLLARPLRNLLAKRGFSKPTRPQIEAIPKILEGKNILLIAPTGTGKTEAAILPILHMLLPAPRVRGIKAIYITPLRALNRDLLERLEWWCRELDLKISVRHGDTAIHERRKQALSPPDVLITTPETLQVVLMGKLLSQHLPTVRWVIVDEVHELADNKRGAQLSLSLERLRRVKAGDFQIIGLSATIGSPEEVAKFLVGVGRKCEVVDATVARKIETDVLYPTPKRGDQMLASELYTYPAVAARLRAMRKLIEKHGSTLVFTNTRPMAEILTSRFRMWDMGFPVSIHHGSLSSFSRTRTEQGLKAGDLKSVVCVSGDSRVLLANGKWAPIYELTLRPDNVCVTSLSDLLKIQSSPVRLVKKTGISPLVQVSTKLGFQLKSTYDHRFLTINRNGNLDWVMARNLKIGSPVAIARCTKLVEDVPTLLDFIPANSYVHISKDLRDKLREILRNKYGTYVRLAKFLSISIDKIKGYLSRGRAMPFNTLALLLREAGIPLKRIQHKITGIGSKNYLRGLIPYSINEKVARTIGFLLADGAITRKDMLRLFNTDRVLLQRYAETLKTEFGSRYTMVKQKSGVWVARFHATWLCELLKKIGVGGGRKAKKIRIPPVFFSSRSNLVFAFLGGYFDGDGCFERHRGKVYSALFGTSSERMARDLQLILLSQGILSALRKKEGKRGPEYVIAILGGRHLRKFLRNCSFWRTREELKEVSEGYSHRDIIPNIGSILRSIRKASGLTTYAIQKLHKIDPSRYERNERTITREKLQQLIAIYERSTSIPKILKSLQNSDIFWDYVSKIEEIDSEPVYDVFDVKDSSNFIVNGFITHNCTSSMELGLDIGRINLCIQYNSPRQVTRLLQRVGRSGHRIGGVAKGAIIVQDPSDALESIVIAARSKRRDLEQVPIPDKPLDVLMHELVGLMAYARRWNVDDVYEIIKGAYPYRDLSKDEVIEVLRYMESLSRKLAWVSPEGEAFARPARHKRLFTYYFENLSMIPQVRQYLVVDDERNEPVGILDESFIAEYGEPGVKFVIGGSAWRIVQVYKNKVYVKPGDDPLGAIPTWIGEEIPVPYSVAQEVGEIRRQVEELTNKGLDLDKISKKLSEQYGVEQDVMKKALEDTFEQLKLGMPVPTHERITVEKVKDMHVVQAHFGTLVNRTLARFIAHQASEELGETVAISIDPYRILLKSKALSPEELVNILKGKLGGEFQTTVKSLIEDSKFFRWRLVQVARRMGVLEQEAELTSRVVDQLMKGLRGTPVHEETFKEVIYKDLDLHGTVDVLEKIKAGKLELVSLGVREEPSPISSLVWKRPTIALEPVSGERLRMLAIVSARARLLSEVRTFACAKCGEYVEDCSIHELDEKPKCPSCGSALIGMAEETSDEVRRALEFPKRKGKIWKSILDTSKLISKHGRLAAVALAARGITPEAAKEILGKEKKLSGKFLELVLRKEREALLKRFKWT